MKITKRYAFQFLPAQMAALRWRSLRKKSKTNGDHSRSIRRNFCLEFLLNESSTSPAMMSFSIAIIVVCRSSLEGEKKR